MRILFLLLYVLLYSSVNVHAQKWVENYKTAVEHYQNGEISVAYNASKNSLENYLAEDGNVSENYASILHLLSTVCYDSTLYQEGITYAQKEIAVRKEISGLENLAGATALYNLGSFYLITSKYEEAEEAFNDALLIYKQYLSSDDQDIISTYWKLGTTYLNLGQYATSCDYFKTGFELYGQPEEVDMDFLTACYDMATASAANNNPEAALHYYNIVSEIYSASGYEETLQNQFVQLHLGDLHKEHGAHSTAIDHYDRVIHLHGLLQTGDESVLTQALKGKAFSLQALGKMDEAAKIYSEHSIEDPSTLNNAAAIAYNEGNYEKAGELYQSALSLLKNEPEKSEKTILEISINLINVYLQQDKIEEAEQLIIEAQDIINTLELTNYNLQSSLFLRKAQLFQKQNNFSKSNENFNLAAELHSSIHGESTAEYVNILNNWSVLQLEHGQYEEAGLLLEKAISIAETIEYPTHELINIYNNQAALDQETGRLGSARKKLDKSIELIEEKNPGAVLRGNTYRQKGLLEIQTGNYANAHELLASAEKDFVSYYGPDHRILAQHSIDIARLLQAEANYMEAEKQFLSAIKRIKESLGTNHPDYLAAVNSFGVLYQTMGNYNEALEQFTISRDGYAALYGTDHPGYATSIENISTIYQLTGEYEKVAPLLHEALRIDRKVYGENHPKYAISLHNLATFYLEEDSFDLARPLLEEALTIYEDIYGSNHSSYASTLFNLAIVHQETGNFGKAEEAMTRTLMIREATIGKDHPDYAFTLFGLATLYHNKNSMDKAWPYYKEGIEKHLYHIKEYFPALSEKEKSAFFNKIKPAFSSFTDFAISYYQAYGNVEVIKELYNLQLSTKAILLNASNKVRDRIFASGDNELIASYQQWTYLKEQLVKMLALSKDEKNTLVTGISDLEDAINTLEKDLSQRSSLFSETFEKESITWDDIRDALQTDEAAIEIIRVSKRFIPDSIYYTALIIKPGVDPVAVIMSEGERLETRFYNYYRNSIQFSIADEISFQHFWQPLAKHLQETKKCFISNDGIYNKISLPTLYDPIGQQHLLDEFDVRLLSNTREIVEKSEAINTTQSAAVFGSPDFNAGSTDGNIAYDPELSRMLGFAENDIPMLPGTKKEAENLRELLSAKNWQTDIYLGEVATEENFKKVKNPAILHVATHGFFMSDISDNKKSIGLHVNNPEANPLFRSGLLLTGAAQGLNSGAQTNGEDGILTAYEAMNLHLDQTEIVILSACETGLGQMRNGEGVYGLQRALIVAGARSVMMSLWKVNDETTMELMTTFYEGLLGGKDKFTAFKEAQIALREKYGDPFHWGAFVLLGQ